MKGARGFSKYFKTGQVGKLYLTNGRHAKGQTFHIQILPEGEKAISNGDNNMCSNKNAVEVYGIIEGQPGWSEIYGWLHEGKWQEDFEYLLGKATVLYEFEDLEKRAIREERKRKEKERQLRLLEAY